MKRVLVTVSNDLAQDQRMQRICASLAAAGYSVALVGRRKSSSTELPRRPFDQVRLPFIFTKGKFFYLELQIRLFGYLLFHSFDIILSVDLDTVLPGLLVARIKSKPLVWDAHEYFEEVPELGGRPVAKAIWTALAKFCIPRVDQAITVGPLLAEELERKYGKRFAVVRNVPTRKPGPMPDVARRFESKHLIYQGALNEGRGLECLLLAMQKLPGFRLTLAGSGDLEQKLRQSVTALRLESRVQFAGNLLPEELHALTPGASLGLNLLESRSQSYYLSLANKVFDYMQAGLPSLNMDFPEYRRLESDNGGLYLLQTLEPQLLADRIQGVFADFDTYQDKTRACTRAAGIWVWEEESKRLLEVFHRVDPDL